VAKKEHKEKKDKSPRIKLDPTSKTFSGPDGLKVKVSIENKGHIPKGWPKLVKDRGSINGSRIIEVKEVQAPSEEKRITAGDKAEKDKMQKV